MLQTVKVNIEGYTDREVARARRAHELYHIIDAPDMRLMKQVSPWITNSPVTTENTNIAIKIFGPDVDTAKGKGTRQKSKEIIDDYIEIPSQLYERNNCVILCIDIMYINKCIFLTGIDKSIRHRSCIPLNSRRGEEITVIKINSST